jgi:hypothetical protein
MPAARFVSRTRFAACTATVLTLLSTGASNAVGVSVRDAALFYQGSADAPPLQLPAVGPVHAATLTPDGAWILYRTVRAGMSLGNGRAYALALRIMRTDGSQAQLLSERRALAAWNARVEDLLLPFSYAPDGREVYFGDHEHVYRFNLAAGIRTVVGEGGFFRVIAQGEWAGFLAVWRARPDSGSRDLWIVNVKGESIRELTRAEVLELTTSP